MNTSMRSTLWQTGAVFFVLVAVFSIYVHAEKQINQAYSLRLRTSMLATELRQSSDELTKMAMTYVITGEPRYKKYFHDIVDIRNGKKPVPAQYSYAYWDIVVANPQSAQAGHDQAIPLIELLRQSGCTDAEMTKLVEAKANSDKLVALELKAMKLVQSGDANVNRGKAIQMLADDHFHKVKASIMKPINEFYRMIDKRTTDAINTATTMALLFRFLFITTALMATFMLWRAYMVLRVTLGGDIDEVYARIAKIGQGDFRLRLRSLRR